MEASAVPDGVGSQVGNVKGFDAQGSVTRPERERFFGARNLLLGVSMLGSKVADDETSFACFATTRTDRTVLPNGDVMVTTRFCYEGNVNRRADFEDGRLRVYAKSLGISGSLWVGSHFLRRSDHAVLRVIGWTVPVVATLLQTRQAIKNIGLTNDIRRGQ